MRRVTWLIFAAVEDDHCKRDFERLVRGLPQGQQRARLSRHSFPQYAPPIIFNTRPRSPQTSIGACEDEEYCTPGRFVLPHSLNAVLGQLLFFAHQKYPTMQYTSCKQLDFHNKVHTLRQLKSKLPGLTHSTSPWIECPVIHRVNNNSHSDQLRLAPLHRSCLHSKSILALSRDCGASRFSVLPRCNVYGRGSVRRTTLYVLPPVMATPSRQFKLP